MATMDGKAKIGKEEFNNLLGMLKSPDLENTTVALQAVENMDFDLNFPQILLLLKYGSADQSQWETYANKAYLKLGTWGYRAGQAMTFRRMCSTLVAYKVNHEDLQFFFDIFSDELKKAVQSTGYAELESLKITLNFKEDEQKRTAGQSQ